MRKLLLIICTAIGLVGLVPLTGVGGLDAQAQYDVDARVRSVLAQFPGGGPGLRAAIAVLLESDPRLADAVVLAAQSATPAQKQAIGYGIADAARFFAVCGGVPTETCRAAEAALRQAIVDADFLTRTAFLDVAGQDMASDIAPTTPVFIPGIGGGNCVSPSAPNSC